jgi:hypothetical protein
MQSAHQFIAHCYSPICNYINAIQILNHHCHMTRDVSVTQCLLLQSTGSIQISSSFQRRHCCSSFHSDAPRLPFTSRQSVHQQCPPPPRPVPLHSPYAATDTPPTVRPSAVLPCSAAQHTEFRRLAEVNCLFVCLFFCFTICTVYCASLFVSVHCTRTVSRHLTFDTAG